MENSNSDKKIGVFGGTFDPIHNGHIHIALFLIEQGYLDKVLFCPTKQNPLKTDKQQTQTSLAHREAMVSIVLSSLDHCQLIQESASSNFFVDTLKDIRQQNPNSKLFFIHGLDILESFHLWNNPEEILSLAQPLIVSRKTDYQKVEEFHPFSQTLKKAIIDVPLFEISSTVIRDRLNRNKACLHLVPQQVLEYIRENDLYKSE